MGKNGWRSDGNQFDHRRRLDQSAFHPGILARSGSSSFDLNPGVAHPSFLARKGPAMFASSSSFKPEAGSSHGPDYSAVDSQAKAEALFERGELAKLERVIS